LNILSLIANLAKKTLAYLATEGFEFAWLALGDQFDAAVRQIADKTLDGVPPGY
jgi:hypothetical protein